jgi:putative hemolysin
LEETVPDDPLLVRAIVLGVLLILSAFFSGSETAFFSLNSLEKDALRRQSKGKSARFVATLFARPDEILATILTGNMFVNIFASSISEAIGSELFREGARFISIGAMTVALLLIGEMTPKNLAIRHSLKLSIFSSRTLYYIHLLLRPVTAPLGAIRHAVLSLYPRSGVLDDELRNDAVLSAIRMGYQSNTIAESELRLLERFFRFREKTAADVMIPRVDCRPIDGTTFVSTLLGLIEGWREAPAGSLIPLCRNDVDHITGYIRRSDLVPYRLGKDGDPRLSQLARPVHAVPSTKPLQELLDEMRDSGAEMAVVVDEYGGTEGLVGYHTVIDYLFGDFVPEGQQTVVEIDDDAYRIAGATELGDVQELLRNPLEGDARTLGGFITDRLGELPRTGASILESGYRFTIDEVDGHRVTWVRVERERP